MEDKYGGQFPDISKSYIENGNDVDELHYANQEYVKRLNYPYRQRALDKVINRLDEQRILFRAVAEKLVEEDSHILKDRYSFTLENIYETFKNGDKARGFFDGDIPTEIMYIPLKHLYTANNSGLISTSPKIFDALRYIYYYYFYNYPKTTTGKVWIYLINTSRAFNVTNVEDGLLPDHLKSPRDGKGRFIEYEIVGYINSNEILGAFEIDDLRDTNYHVKYLENPYYTGNKLSSYEIFSYVYDIQRLSDKFN